MKNYNKITIVHKDYLLNIFFYNIYNPCCGGNLVHIVLEQ